ncbi:MAG TPA: hypothetical protein VML96_03920 [Egibacteraceae bacterium]|nr:hypothetical protein [Egibacteraceae bacterium]
MSLDLLGLVLLAVEEASHEWVPPWDWRAQVALPAGLLIFFGSVFLLLRSNLGARRAYLVEATSFFGFMIILALFWTFGAPGTPIATGPITLPGQPLDAYQPTWTPFAGDSVIAEDERFVTAKTFPEGWTEVPDAFAAQADTGVQEIQSFFGEQEAGSRIPATWVPVGDTVRYREATNGFPMISAEFKESYQPNADGSLPEGVSETQIGQPIPDGATFRAFAFFDAGNIQFPSIVMLAVMTVAFLIHLALLALDERREQRELAEDAAHVAEERERVSAEA